jgi:tRNA A37 threonylcarbamoyladenosine dehydratase
MDEINILLVGVGGIGFRHFQSLAAFALPANLMIVDVDQNALNKAKEYFGTLENDKIA